MHGVDISGNIDLIQSAPRPYFLTVMQNCTIVSPVTGFHELLRNARSFISGEVTIDGDRECWNSIEVVSPGEPSAKIVFNSLVFTVPDGEFSRLVRSMGNKIRRVDTPLTDVRERVLKQVYQTKWFVGVVADPAISQQFENCIFATADDLDAMIFNGTEMLDATGGTILSW